MASASDVGNFTLGLMGCWWLCLKFAPAPTHPLTRLPSASPHYSPPPSLSLAHPPPAPFPRPPLSGRPQRAQTPTYVCLLKFPPPADYLCVLR